MNRAAWTNLTDGQLLAQCEVDTYRASGPGGQKRNKTDSAVRLRHRPTGLIVTAADSRSQHQNRARALRRLRAALAFDRRQDLPDEAPPPEVAEQCAAGRLGLGPKDPRFLPAAAWILDLLVRKRGRVAETAERIGIPTAKLVKFLQQDPDAWTAANRIRADHGQKPLRGE